MADLTTAIPLVRESVAAILRVHMKRPATNKGGQQQPGEAEVTFGGSAVCVVEDRYLVTAVHVLGAAGARDPRDRFYAFTVPGNGDPAFHFPVVGFPLEHTGFDLAVLEIGPCATEGGRIPPLPVSFDPQPDGTRVVTMGYPAPEIGSINIGHEGDYQGGEFFLKSHANEGIVSAQYETGGGLLYELNVGWHHGESGGPVVSVEGEPAVFSLMQHYRNIESPHGTLAGPHRGYALSAIRRELTDLGVVGARG